MLMRSSARCVSHELRNEVVEELSPDLMSESRAERDAPLVRGGRNRGMESKKGIEGQPGKEARRLHSEKQACPRRGNPTAVKTALSRRQTERDGKTFWDAEESNGHAARCWDSRIANQPLLKVETIMRSLCTGQGRRSEIRAGREPLLSLHLHTLGTQQLSAHPSMVPTTPISPEQGRGTDNKGMQEHTHLARLGGSAALPLTLFPQGTGATTADAGRIDHTQAPVGFSAPLMRDQ